MTDRLVVYCTECGQGEDLGEATRLPREVNTVRTMCRCGGMRSTTRRAEDGGVETVFSFTVPVRLVREQP